MFAAFSRLRMWPRGRKVYTGCTPMCQHHPLLSHPALAQQVFCPVLLMRKRGFRGRCARATMSLISNGANIPMKGHLTFRFTAARCSGNISQLLEGPPLLPSRTKRVASGPHCPSSFFSQLSRWMSRAFHDARAKPSAHS